MKTAASNDPAPAARRERLLKPSQAFLLVVGVVIWLGSGAGCGAVPPGASQPATEPVGRDGMSDLRAEKHVDGQEREWGECVRISDPHQRIARLTEDLNKFKDTAVEGDLRLLLADDLHRSGESDKALEILKYVAQMDNAKSLDRAMDLWGQIPEAIEGEETLCEYYYNWTQPTPSRDLALLAMADIYRKKGQSDAVWDTLKTLRERYPNGQLVKEDVAFADDLRKKGMLAAGPLHDDEPYADFLLMRSRPHQDALIMMSDWIDKPGPDGKPLLNKSATEHISVIYDLVNLYHDLMTVEDLSKYSKQGLALIEQVRKNPPVPDPAKLGTMQALFEKYRNAP